MPLFVCIGVSVTAAGGTEFKIAHSPWSHFISPRYLYAICFHFSRLTVQPDSSLVLMCVML